MDKKSLSERDICTKFITPALRQVGWDEMSQIREEVSMTNEQREVRRKTRMFEYAERNQGADPEDPDEYRAHASGNGSGGRAKADISIYGQESNYTTWRLAKMNLAIRRIVGQIAHGDTFHNDRHPGLKADDALASGLKWSVSRELDWARP